MTSHEDSRLRPALAIRWTASKIHVRCPYCLCSHGRGFFTPTVNGVIAETRAGWSFCILDTQRLSDGTARKTRGRYRLVFPGMDDDTARDHGWVLDRKRRELMTTDPDGIIVSSVEDSYNGRRFIEKPEHERKLDDVPGESESNAPYRQTSSIDPSNRLLLERTFRSSLYFSCCVLGKLTELESLIRSYPVDGLIGSVDGEGSSGVVLAASEENGLMILQWLQKQGDPIDQPN